ncbi:MAG: histidinol dehydrogenase [Eubacteriaceae bacterium]|nr:histidinol dehydrogenase [Eubacteriaceae bacterium]
MKILDVKQIGVDEAKKQISLRAAAKLKDIQMVVEEIIADVELNKDSALRHYTKKFDGVDIDNFAVPQEDIVEAMELLPDDVKQIFQESIDNIHQFHALQVFQDVVVDEPGRRLVQKAIPLASVGLYVPAGSFPYPSTVFMLAVPAKAAGVERIALITPPQKDGKASQIILAAAGMAGVKEVYLGGGAQAIAALAYGTESIPKVDKICGPGNAYVAMAKKTVFGDVDIEMVAGPSEVLIIADDSADAELVALDLLAQAEHDREAASVLVTVSPKLAEDVSSYVGKYLDSLWQGDSIARQSIESNGAIIIAESLEQAACISNSFAPEHLEVCCIDHEPVIRLIKNAGCVFIGKYTAEALGDYMAGTNHTLPTSGTARFSSPLSTYDFMKKLNYVEYGKEAFGKIAPKVVKFANLEGLVAHGKSVSRRIEKYE